MNTATLITLVLGLLQFSNKLMAYVQEDALRESGKAEQIRESLAALARKTTKVRDAEDKVRRMSTDDVLNELQSYTYEDRRSGT